MTLKQNLKTYLSQYRMITDAVNINDAFIINIGVNFEIIVRPNYNNRLVLNNCLTSLQSYFNIDKWQINQPIILPEIYSNLDQVEGVQTVQKVEITNKAGSNACVMLILDFGFLAHAEAQRCREKIYNNHGKYPSSTNSSVNSVPLWFVIL